VPRHQPERPERQPGNVGKNSPFVFNVLRLEIGESSIPSLAFPANYPSWRSGKNRISGWTRVPWYLQPTCKDGTALMNQLDGVGLMNLTGLCCYLEALGAADPLARRRGLQALTKSVSEAPLHVRVQFIARHSFNLIIERMQDPVEKCRDISLGLITSFVRECSVDDLEHKGRQIISAAIARFGSRPFQEPVEELRLRYLPCDWIVSRSIFYISK